MPAIDVKEVTATLLIYRLVMLNMSDVILTLKQKASDLKIKLENRRLQMVDQDSANVSRYITATRGAVEQEIEAMDNELIRLELGIKELDKLKSDQKRYSEKYFVTDEFEFLDLGIISKKTKLGQEILRKNK